MDRAVQSKISAKSAPEVCQLYTPSLSARTFLRAEQAPPEFVEALFEAGLYVDVVDFLAHALSKRDAIWWACVSVRHALGPVLPPKEFAALKAAVEWVLAPDEPKRRAAEAAGIAVGFGTPAGCAALAVYGSGGSLGPANLPEVPPEPDMTARAVSGSITMACVKGDPYKIPEVQRDLAQLGIAIAQGKVTWPDVTKTPPRSPALGIAPGNRF